jgi:hypothetical protein
MDSVELYRPDGDVEIVLDGDSRQALMRLKPLPALVTREVAPPSSAFLAALHTLGLASPGLQTVLREAASKGEGLTVAFPAEIVTGLRTGAFHLMQSANGALPVAVDSAGKIAAHARVVGSATAAGAVGGAAAGATVGAVAIVALPILIASAAAYAQQRQLEKSLASIQAVVERIEARLEDTDSGVCDAAEQFLMLIEDSLAEGGLTEYLRLELASQRTAVEALYGARRRWVQRFKLDLEREQIKRERSKGRGQPWVDTVVESVKGGKLEQELTLFIRSLLSRTKLSVLAAAALAEEGRGSAAMQLINRSEIELRSEFFDLHRRLVPLARVEPELSVFQKLPGMGGALERAHETVKTLVEHLNLHVLPVIPDPYNPREVEAVLSPATVLALSAGLG